MIGIYAIAGKSADDAFLAAVLTVIGYSVMDTIVILDRIRENTRIMVGVSYDTIVNESIKQTMTRSFNTLATVVITLVALLALGGASLQNFGFALLVGICSGGYHSIFYSAPLVLVFRKRQIEAAARKRRASVAMGSAPAAVRSDSSSRVSRDDVVAARRARREKQKATRAPQSSPVRYKRRREEGATMVEETPVGADYDEHELLGEDLGHEEINLNLEGFDVAAPEHEPDEPHQES
jgi:predicted RND superfamily exporter protein